MKKNIALSCLNLKQHGGAERYVLALINSLNKINIKPTVYAVKFDQTLPEYQMIIPIKLPLRYIPQKFRLPLFSEILKKIKNKDMTLIAINPNFCDIAICGGNHQGFINATNKKVKFYDRIKINQEYKSYNNAKIIVAHSELMKKELIHFYNIPKEKIQVIYPPIDENIFNLKKITYRNELRKKYHFSDRKITFIFPSTGHKRKGFELLADYFNHSSLPIELIVVGSPIEDSYKCYNNIRELGFCKNMAELYTAADFTIMASIYEPFGLIGIESVLCGTPVVMSDNMACTEVINENGCFLFSREHTASLDTAIKSAVQKAQAKQARISEPHLALTYDTSLSTHIEKLINLL